MKRFILYLAIFVTVLFWGIPETPAGDISDHAQDNHLNDDSTPPALAPVPPGRGSGEGSKIFVVWYEYDTSSTEYKIWFDMSTDKGTTWNTDERVDSGTASDRRYHASIASKTPIAGGVNLYTAWLDERNTSDREVFFSRSTNQGDDWSTDLAIASPGDVGNNAILPPGIAIDHGNDDVMEGVRREQLGVASPTALGAPVVEADLHRPIGRRLKPQALPVFGPSVDQYLTWTGGRETQPQINGETCPGAPGAKVGAPGIALCEVGQRGHVDVIGHGRVRWQVQGQSIHGHLMQLVL